MRIECKTTFLDGTVRFEDGDIVTVPDADAQRFIDNGWAAEVGKEATAPSTDPVDLDIHNSAIGLGDSNG